MQLLLFQICCLLEFWLSRAQETTEDTFNSQILSVTYFCPWKTGKRIVSSAAKNIVSAVKKKKKQYSNFGNMYYQMTSLLDPKHTEHP